MIENHPYNPKAGEGAPMDIISVTDIDHVWFTAIDFFFTVGTAEGKLGEKRVISKCSFL